MGRSGGVQVVIAVALLVAALSPVFLADRPNPDSALASVPEPRIGHPGEGAPAGGDDGGIAAVADRRLSPSVDQRVRVVADVESTDSLPEHLQRRYTEVIGREGTRRLTGTVSLSEVREFSNAPGVGAVHIRETPNVTDRYVARGIRPTGIATLQEEGFSGEGVTVGVIDSGFRITHPAIAEHVGSYQVFSGSGDPVHGTAVASVVADAAPEAELHLAAVGPRTTASEYREAVRWLVDSGADVVVDAGSYFGRPTDESGPIAAVATEAADEVAFVTSAGNYANRHWSATLTPTSTEWIDFGENQRNYLADGKKLSGRVTVGLQWNGSADYDLYLWRETGAGEWVWESSTDGRRAENLSVTVPRGRYYVSVRASELPENRSSPVRLSLFANRQLGERTAAGSITVPATAPGVIAVGATNGSAVRSFSSRGPTTDGRVGVDVVAPDDVRIAGADLGNGTSFSAPYVAGTIALLKSEYERVSARAIGHAVVQSAGDLGREGPDPASGHGLLDAVAAARTVGRLSEDDPETGVESESESEAEPDSGAGASGGSGGSSTSPVRTT